MIGLDLEDRERPTFEPEPARPAPVRDETAEESWEDDDWEEDWLFL